MIKKRFKLVLLTLIIICFGYILVNRPATKPVKQSSKKDSPSLTLRERIEKRSLAIEKSQKEHQIKEKEFVNTQYTKKPIIPHQDLSQVNDTDNKKMHPTQQNEDRLQMIVEELKKPFLDNPDHEDLQNSIRRHLSNREWLEENLQNTDEQEKQNFIKKFVQIAKEQGYKVHFPATGWKVVLEPIDTPSDKTKSEEEFETPIIRWQ